MEVMHFSDKVELIKKDKQVSKNKFHALFKKELTDKIALNSSTVSMSSGAFSMRKRMQSLKMGTVVSMTKIEKRKVQIGSAMVQSGLT